MIDDFSFSFWKGLGVTLGVITGIELAVIMLVLFSYLEMPHVKIVQFKRYNEGVLSAEEAPSND